MVKNLEGMLQGLAIIGGILTMASIYSYIMIRCVSKKDTTNGNYLGANRESNYELKD